MRFAFAALPAFLLAGAALAQGDGSTDARDPRAKVPPVQYRSALEGYRPFVEPDLRDWRKSNEEVGAAAGRAGQPPAQGRDKPAAKPPADPHGGHK